MTTATMPNPATATAAGVYAQYGCGLCAPDGWLNFDASPTLRLQRVWGVGRVVPGPRFPANARYGDIVKGLPLPDASCAGVYCSHTLEHLSYEDGRAALRNSLRLLRPGGTFRFVLPDLRMMAEHYVASRGDPEAAVRFMQGTLLGEQRRRRGVGGLVRAWVGNADHRWMWDYESMAHELRRVGFTDVRRAAFGDSTDPMFARVEEAGRWEDALGVECRRPQA